MKPILKKIKSLSIFNSKKLDMREEFYTHTHTHTHSLARVIYKKKFLEQKNFSNKSIFVPEFCLFRIFFVPKHCLIPKQNSRMKVLCVFFIELINKALANQTQMPERIVALRAFEMQPYFSCNEGKNYKNNIHEKK
jgi:hypothetical protein